MAEEDIRLGELITPGDDGDVVIVGFPYDEGVRRNHGRVGAADAPEFFRKAIRRIGTVPNPQTGVDVRCLKVTDSGDIPRGLELEEAHKLLTERVAAIIRRGGVPFVIGGGHDMAYPDAKGLLDAHEHGRVGVVNVDAHMDVRPLRDGRVHSGSPFRLLLEDAAFRGELVEYGLQPHQCSVAHAAFLRGFAAERGRGKTARLVWFDEAQRGDAAARFTELLAGLAARFPDVFVSFDMDAISAAFVPGVSCPAALGFSAREAVAFAAAAGASPAVRLFDMPELNPSAEAFLSFRLAATMFHAFVEGVAARRA